jgi:alkaline phosphatase D
VRTMLGSVQYNWFIDKLKTSTAKWKVIGNQVLFADLNVGFAARNGQGMPAPNDITAIRAAEKTFINTWESYPTERNAIIDTLKNAGIDNVVIVTGDSHCSWAFDVTKQPAIYPDPSNNNYASPSPSYNSATGKGSVAVEFCVPSISSANMDERIGAPLATQFQNWVNSPIFFLNNSTYNPHLKYADVSQHGYFILDLKDDSAQANYYYVDKINVPSTAENFGKNAFTLNKANRVLTNNNQAAPKAKQEIPAPTFISTILSANEIDNAIVFYAYPNPTADIFNLQYGIYKTGQVKIIIQNTEGKTVSQWQQQQEAGLYNYTLNVSSFESGIYIYTLEIAGKLYNGKFLVR